MSPADFERAVLSAFGWTPETVPIARLAEAYRALSEAINLAEASGGPTGRLSGGFSEPEVSATWALIYGARTLTVAGELLAAHPLPAGPVLELGAGWGPFGLAAAAAGAEAVRLVELSEARLGRAGAIYRALGFRAPEVERGDARRVSLAQPAGIGVAYALGEMIRAGGSEEAFDDTVVGWVQGLRPGGRLFLVEPGTLLSAHRLQGLRDRIEGRVRILAPCPQIAVCPMERTPKDWCHFTWSTPTGSVAQAVADRAERRWQELHFSYLVLGRPDEAPPETPARLLELRPRGKAKLEGRVCTPTGLQSWVVLERHQDAHVALAGLRPGAVLAATPGALVPKGDGLRIESKSAFRSVRGL